MSPDIFHAGADRRESCGTFCEDTSRLFHLDRGARRSGPRIMSEYEADLIARNREIARLPFTWET